MKSPLDTQTLELAGLPPVPKKRGRPSTGKALTGAERVRKHRESKGLVALTVEIPEELFQRLNDYMKFKGKTKNEVIEHLLESQLLRKR